MRPLLVIVLMSTALASAADGVMFTAHYATEQELLANIVDGFFYVGRGDTQQVSIRRKDPPGSAERPFTLWNDGQPHAFQCSYNGSGLAAMGIDNVFVDIDGIQVDRFDGLVVTACSEDPGVSIRVDDLVITDHNLHFYPVAEQALAVGPAARDYLLIATDMNLAEGVILSGTATLDWGATLPGPNRLWFEVAPVLLPEPSACAALAGLGLGLRLLRPRR
jgi:hypothetical protein